MSVESFIRAPEVSYGRLPVHVMHVPSWAWCVGAPKQGSVIPWCYVHGDCRFVELRTKDQCPIFHIEIIGEHRNDIEAEIAHRVWMELAGTILHFAILGDDQIMVKFNADDEQRIIMRVLEKAGK